jgi:RNA polymerase sigma-70 factor (ECF subfamily)
MPSQVAHSDLLSRNAASRATVVPLSTSDAAIVKGLVAKERWAANALYDRYAQPIEAMLRHTLGHERHADLEDLLHDVFVQALGSASSLRDSVALLAWLQTIAARIAFRTMRRRKARAWLLFGAPESLPEVATRVVGQEIRQACARFYVVMAKLPASEQLVFSLRYIEGMEIGQIADVCEISLSTAKRRLRKARERFYRMAAAEPELAAWMTERGGET